MFLHKLYLEPGGFFDPIKFTSGINFIYAKKDSSSDAKNSLNGVGKSMILNLIDFCLLSGETEHIKSAKENNDLSGQYAVLEFKIGDDTFIIKRPFDTPNKAIFFGKKGEELKEYGNTTKNKHLSKILCDLCFKNDDYQGKYSDLWLRRILPFFIKSQSSKTKVNFQDPVLYMSNAKDYELIIYHLFLMGINNALFYKNFDIVVELKKKSDALKEINALVTESYQIDPQTAESELVKLRSEIQNYEEQIAKFKLEGTYEGAENESNEITEKIKELWYQNHRDKRKIEAYEESFALDDDVNAQRVARMYKDLNELLAENIKKTLNEALSFRKNLSESRKNFLQDEISSLQKQIEERSQKIENLEGERSKLFRFLEEKEAIKDLSEAFLSISKKKTRLGDLEGKLRIYRDLKEKYAELSLQDKTVSTEIEKMMRSIDAPLSDFRNIFFEVHDSIYKENRTRSNFIFDTNTRKKSKVDVNVTLPSSLSYGKNKGRTLIYDLAILFSLMKRGFASPRFLIHDGIFDGIDKAHFVSLHNFLKEKSAAFDFQYIVTINQEGTIKDFDFGAGAEDLTENTIESEAIKILTPSKPLFGKIWD
jgi:uncharacterized protein YydD (DUF2326 family)